MSASSRDPKRNQDIQKIRDTYARYQEEGRSRIWNPANPGFSRMMQDRDRDLLRLLNRSVPQGGKVLDLGSGDGRLVAVAHEGGLPIGSWVGVDLDAARVARAAASYPWANFVVASGDRLPFATGTFDVVVTSTLFSSLPSAELEQSVAREIGRVLRQAGWLIWYDLRYDNPRNREVHGIGRAALLRLFPGWRAELGTTTLLPPVARRLGRLTSQLYGPLERVPALRSHLLGRLQRPA